MLYFVYFLILLLTFTNPPLGATAMRTRQSKRLSWVDKCTKHGVTHVSHRGDGQGLPEVYDALTSCPDITSLSLDIGHGGGCVVNSAPWFFDFKEGDRFPALKKLEVWKARYFINNWIPSFAAPKLLSWVEEPEGPDAKVTNIEKWQRAMNFSQLEELTTDIDDDRFYTAITSTLSNLRSLTLDLPYRNHGTISPAILTFLHTLPPLKTLNLRLSHPTWSCPDPKNHTHTPYPRTPFPLATILNRHGPALTRLTLHQSETTDPLVRRPMLTPAEIADLNAACPGLAHLGLDIDRDGNDTDTGTGANTGIAGFPLEVLDALMLLPNLTTLDLGLELGLDVPDKPKPKPKPKPNPKSENESDADPDAETESDADPDYADPIHQENINYMYIYDEPYNHPRLKERLAYRQPLITKRLARRLFSYMRARKVGRALERVEFVVGDRYSSESSRRMSWRSTGSSYPSWWLKEREAKVLVCGWAEERVIPAHATVRVIGGGDYDEDEDGDDVWYDEDLGGWVGGMELPDEIEDEDEL